MVFKGPSDRLVCVNICISLNSRFIKVNSRPLYKSFYLKKFNTLWVPIAVRPLYYDRVSLAECIVIPKCIDVSRGVFLRA
ncbi:hypothetical protein AOQ84DRAFT_83422 [Glonium stellatum]|uniref:Uncharacterized protein n=1 Tax=Glonium stellatum TaxID=574774 RepID=A0A8E2EWY7_9PEZI|nr:hypothetical protein AOQ84DRAFT_83422 [Glonium stellatum]